MADSIEYVVREFNDRGLIWLLESPNNLERFIRLFAAEIAEVLDFTRAERVPRSYVTSGLEKTETDILFRLPARYGKSEVLIYILNELQSAPDNQMGLKINLRRDEIWKHERRLWQELPSPRPDLKLHLVVHIVFYTGDQRWNMPVGMEGLIEAPDGMSKFIPRWETLFVSLNATPVDLLMNAGTGLALALRGLKATGSPPEEMKAVVAQIVAGLSQLPPESQQEWKTAMHFLTLMIRHKRPQSERDMLFNAIKSTVDKLHRAEVETMLVTDADFLRQEGREKGREEGFRDLFVHILEDRFGALTDTVASKVRSLSEKEVMELGIRLNHVKSFDELGLRD